MFSYKLFALILWIWDRSFHKFLYSLYMNNDFKADKLYLEELVNTFEPYLITLVEIPTNLTLFIFFKFSNVFVKHFGQICDKY